MKRLLGLAAVLLSLAFTAGCPYTARTPLGEPERGAFDERLVGLWTAAGAEGDSAVVRVFPFNEAEYYVELVEGEGETSRFRVFALDVGGQRFLNINGLYHESAADEHIFARCSFSENGELSIRFVGEKIVPKTLAADPEALRAFLASHLDDPALDDEDVKLLLRRRS